MEKDERLEKAILMVRDLIIERLQKEKYCQAQTMGQALQSLLVYRNNLSQEQPTLGIPC